MNPVSNSLRLAGAIVAAAGLLLGAGTAQAQARSRSA
jgi:hypothetical protein